VGLAVFIESMNRVWKGYVGGVSMGCCDTDFGMVGVFMAGAWFGFGVGFGGFRA